MHKVLVVGDASVDLIVPYPKFLDESRKNVEYPVINLQGGGTSANTAVALARLGATVDFLGTVGDDQYGRYIVNDFVHEGVSIEQLIIDPEYNTIGVFAFVDEVGERYLWGWPRVDQAFKEIDENKINFDKLSEFDWIHTSGMALVHDSSARYSIIKVFEKAFELGIPTSFDLNLRVDAGVLDEEYARSVYEIIKYSTVVLGSATDEFYYLGKDRDWKKNALALADDNKIIVVRNGGQGSTVFCQGNEINVPAYSVKVEDTVGAGDVYNAGFIVAYLSGEPMEYCLKYANAVSGYTVQKKGSRGCPTSLEVQKFMKEHNK